MPPPAEGGLITKEMEETKVRTAPLAKPNRSTMFFGAMQAARAKLTLIRGDGLDGVSFSLAGEEHLAGRVNCPILFPDDLFFHPFTPIFSTRPANLWCGMRARLTVFLSALPSPSA
jgi:hypothetical protein